MCLIDSFPCAVLRSLGVLRVVGPLLSQMAPQQAGEQAGEQDLRGPRPRRGAARAARAAHALHFSDFSGSAQVAVTPLPARHKLLCILLG
mmetsp:Transcript_50458/g.109572  ORF Transcript_50458/g.109572 Transcript_50458/m.109572 type:complete len:90 (-) Transcript_50458:90-359(-)